MRAPRWSIRYSMPQGGAHPPRKYCTGPFVSTSRAATIAAPQEKARAARATGKAAAFFHQPHHGEDECREKRHDDDQDGNRGLMNVHLVPRLRDSLRRPRDPHDAPARDSYDESLRRDMRAARGSDSLEQLIFLKRPVCLVDPEEKR